MTKIRENGATSGVGLLATFAYDDLGRRTSLTRGNGTVKSYTYDSVSRLVSLGEDLSGTSADLSQTFTYNPASQVASVTRSNDSYAWTDHYNLTRNYGSNGLNQYTSSGSVTPTYDTKGNLTSGGGATYAYSSENLLTSASGGIALAYDPMLRLYQVAGGSGGTRRYAYDGQDLIAEYNSSNAMLRRYVHGSGEDEILDWYEGSETSDQNGIRKKTYVAYDATTGLSRKSVVRMCLYGATCGTSQEIRTEYLYWGSTFLPSRERRIDAYFGRTRDTNFTYDPAGRLLIRDGPLPGTDDAVYTRYDDFGRKSWEIGARAPNGLRIATRFTYRNSDDKPLSSETGTLPDAGSSTLTVLSRTDTAYDARRNPVREAASAGGTTYTVSDRAYDDRGRLECAATRMNMAAFEALPASACTLGTQGSQGPDRITHNVYDAASQLLQIQRAYGTSLQQNYATYEYTPNGKQKAVTDANGNRAEMTWDGFDRQKRWIFPSNTPGTANQGDYEEYGYDIVGNRTSLRKRDGSVLTFLYDALNRVIRKTVPERAGLTAAQTRDVYYDYDVRGLQTKARFDALDGEGVTNYYDLFGLPTTTLLSMGGYGRYVSYYHDDAGNRVRLTHPDNAAFAYAYDALGRVTAMLDNPAATSLDDYVIRYWYNAAGNRSGVVRGAGAGGFTTVYYRDPLERPTTIANDLPGTANDAPIELAYNPASQIVSRTVSNNAYATPPETNRSLAYQVNGLNQYIAASNRTYVYDANGNLISDGTSSYVYDVENRLVSASGATNAALAYDPLGRLFQTSGAGGAGVTQFLYDGDALVAEYNGSGALTKRYVHGPGADDPVAVYDGPALGLANRRYMMPDERGSIAALVNADGVPSVINTYDSWGIPGAANQGRFQYTGQAWIPELGMYYYKARIYSPILGRFMQTDPVGYKDQVNLYAYVGNDPVNFGDPTGMCSSIANEVVRAACLEKREAAIEGARQYLGSQSVRSGQDEAAYIATFNEVSGEVTVRTGDSAGVRTNTEVVFTDNKGEQLRAQRDGRIVERVDGGRRTTHDIVLVTGHAHPRENPGGGAASRALDRANDNIRSNQNDRTLSRVAPAVIKGTTGTIRVYVNGEEVE